MAWIETADRLMTDYGLQLRPGDIPGQTKASLYLTWFGEQDRYKGEENWRETIERDAVERAVSARPTMRLFVDGGGIPIARTSSGTLKLWVDPGGLRMDAVLLSTDPNVQRLRTNQCAEFTFWVKREEWTSTRSHRRIREMDLNNCDISILTR